MKLIEVGRDPLQPDVVRVVVERLGETSTLLRDGEVWRHEDDGEAANPVFAENVDRLLWLRRREHARKVQEERVKVERMQGLRPGECVITLKDAGKVVAETRDNGTTWTHVGTSAVRDVPSEAYVSPQEFVERAAPTLPPELSKGEARTILEGLGEALAHAQGEAIGATEWRRGPGMPLHDGGTLTAEEFAQAQDGVHTGEAVLTQRALEAMGAVLCGAHPSDPCEVYVPRAVTVALVEAPENVVVRGLAPAHEVFVDTGRQFPWVSLEASTEGLRKLHEVIGAELRRREEG